MSFKGAHPSGQDDADLKAKAYNAGWRAAHPGYMAAKCRAWRDTNPRSPSSRGVRAYKELENWRRRCKRSGVIPPPEAYWRNRRGE
jgi:hypothetical protein